LTAVLVTHALTVSPVYTRQFTMHETGSKSGNVSIG
jgi:hypothetical protein